MTRALPAVALLLLAGCSPGGGPAVAVVDPPAEDAGYFLDRTAGSGIDHTYRNGQEAGHLAILESLGGGVALIDYDRDGRLDVFVTGGGHFAGDGNREIRGHPSRLYRNLGGWTFEDVTAAAGLEGPLFYTHGAAVADYDRDGWPDLLVTGYGRVALYHNEPDGKGGRRFAEVTEKAGLAPGGWATSAGWADFDGDGRPDLYVGHYTDWSWAKHPRCSYRADLPDVCPPRQFDALPNRLYRNRGDGTFADASEAAGLYQRDCRRHSKTLGVVIADVDDDGRPDVYAATDEMNNLLYLNRGGMRFDEVGLLHGAALDDNGNPNGSMGVDAADYDGSGRVSLWVTNYQNEVHGLYRNRGGGQFVYASKRAGVAAIGTGFVGFGTKFVDVDRDGTLDLIAVNGHVIRHPSPPAEIRQRPVLLRNLRTPGQPPHEVAFADESAKGGAFFRDRHTARGLAVGDLDDDGRPDLVVSRVNEPVVVLQNVLDNGRHWLGVALAPKDRADPAGAKATLEVEGDRLTRVVVGGGSYLSAGDQRILFGLGTRTAAGPLTVRWPSGRVQTWPALPIDRYVTLAEGEPDPRPHPAPPPQ
jgi:hypothetical protein